MQLFSLRARSAKASHDQGWISLEANRYTDAEREFRKAVAVWEEKLGLNHIDTLDSKRGLALSLVYQQGKSEEAEKYFREIIPLFEAKKGLEHIDTLESKRGLAWSLHRQGKGEEAEKYFREIVPLYEAKRGLDHIGTLESKYGLAWSLAYQQGKNEEAEKYFREVIPLFEAKQGLDHIHTLDSKYGLAWSLHAQGKNEEAEKYFREVIPLFEAKQGLDHIHTLDSKRGLAWSLAYQQGKNEEAEKYFREVIPLFEAKQGLDHIHTLDSKYGLAWSLHAQGKNEEAEKYFREVIPLFEAKQGLDHINTLDSKYGLAWSLHRQGKDEEAERYFREAKLEIPARRRPQRPADKIIFDRVDSLSRTSPEQHQLSNPADHQADSQANSTLQEAGGSAGIGRNRHITPESESSLQEPYARSSTPVRERALPRESTTSPASVSEASEQVSDHLNRYFGRNEVENLLFGDSEISKIASLLQHLKPQWSKYPRTYIVLRWIDCIHLFDGLIALGFSDYSFPTTEKILPQLLSPNQKSDFVNAQRMVLTRSLGLEKGRHCYVAEGESLPLRKQRVLGKGGFGQVDEVLSLISYVTYARKRVIRKSSPELLQLFVAELTTIKRLKHKHVVEFIGSYSDTKYLGLLMLPVAEMDLSTYLTRPDIGSHLNELRTFFGCLATALEFLHSQGVRHKDIKPENILTHRGNVLLTDFGLSHDFSDGQRSTTVGMVDAMTPRYCAPEVAEHEPRNTSSDIWSLGLVFLGMVVVLKDLTREYMDDYYAEHGSRRPWVRLNPNGTAEFIASLRATGRKSDNEVLGWVEAMLQKQPHKRLTAAQLVTTINNPDGVENVSGKSKFCGLCCTPHDDFSDFSD